MKIVEEECCGSCGSTENLIEAGGQFCGGTCHICQRCEDKANSFSEFIKSGAYMELLRKTIKEEK